MWADFFLSFPFRCVITQALTLLVTAFPLVNVYVIKVCRWMTMVKILT